MSMSTAFIISLTWILVLVGASFYNHVNKRKALFYSSVFALGFYVFAHVANTLYFTSAPIAEVLKSYYLFYAVIPSITALGLFFINKDRLTVIMKISLILLCIEGVMSYAIHIDRNVIALNAAAMPNVSGAAKWWLWDIQSYISFANNITVLFALTLSNIYQVKTEDNTQAFEILEDVERYVKPFKASESKERTSIFLEMSVQNLFEPNDTLRDKQITKVGVYLLNEAIRECCYEPHRKQPVNAFGRFIYWLRS